MTLLCGYWGVTTIFLFWGAMIRMAREWGGSQSQGIAFGILALYLPVESLEVSGADRRQGLRSVILLYSSATAICGVLAWFLLPDAPTGSTNTGPAAAGVGPGRGDRLRLQRLQGPGQLLAVCRPGPRHGRSGVRASHRLGFLPAPRGGRILDRSPGLEGHQDYFLLLAVFALLGLAAAAWLAWAGRKKKPSPEH